MIKAFVDEAQNARVIVPHDAVAKDMSSHPYERHITVTHEGIVIDIVVDGEIVESSSWEHHDLLDYDPEDA